MNTKTHESPSVRARATAGIDPSHTRNLFFTLPSADGLPNSLYIASGNLMRKSPLSRLTVRIISRSTILNSIIPGVWLGLSFVFLSG